MEANKIARNVSRNNFVGNMKIKSLSRRKYLLTVQRPLVEPATESSCTTFHMTASQDECVNE